LWYKKKVEPRGRHQRRFRAGFSSIEKKFCFNDKKLFTFCGAFMRRGFSPSESLIVWVFHAELTKKLYGSVIPSCTQPVGVLKALESLPVSFTVIPRFEEFLTPSLLLVSFDLEIQWRTEAGQESEKLQNTAMAVPAKVFLAS
jgi:hypothetical protein